MNNCTPAAEAVMMMSPALECTSEGFPEAWAGRVPKRVRATKTVHPDFSFAGNEGVVAVNGEEYLVWVNAHGALAAIMADGLRRLGLRPGEFEVVEFHGVVQ